MKFDIFDTVYFMHSNRVYSSIILEVIDSNKIYKIDFKHRLTQIPEKELFATKKELLDSL